MDEGTGENKKQEVRLLKSKTAEESFAPFQAVIDKKISQLTLQINCLIEQRKAQPDTEYGRIQKQIADLGIAILTRDKIHWQANGQLWLIMVELKDAILKVKESLGQEIVDRPTIKQSFSIAARLIAEVDAQSEKADPPELNN